MKKNIFFVLVAALLLAPWPVVYAYDGVNGDTASLAIRPAEAANLPQYEAFGKAVGSVVPGDLFEVDTTGTTADTMYKLCITNADELVPNYRFMNLKIGIYVQAADGGWEELNATGGETPLVFISMHGGMTDFSLPGGAKYKITIDKGCFYCYGAAPGTTIATPAFYLTTG